MAVSPGICHKLLSRSLFPSPVILHLHLNPARRSSSWSQTAKFPGWAFFFFFFLWDELPPPRVSSLSTLDTLPQPPTLLKSPPSLVAGFCSCSAVSQHYRTRTSSRLRSRLGSVSPILARDFSTFKPASPTSSTADKSCYLHETKPCRSLNDIRFQSCVDDHRLSGC